MIRPGEALQAYEPGEPRLLGGKYGSDSYRWGFNGQEKDNEVYGSEGTSYDYGFRNYDPRIGRFCSIDPRTHEYPWQTPYAYHRNNFIAWIDYMGGGDPPKVIDGVYFVQLKNPNAQVVFNMGLNTFTGMMKGRYDNANTVDYTVNTQQYGYSNLFSAGLRALSSSTGSNPYITMGQNVDNGRVSGDGTDRSRGYLAQDQNGQWQGGLGNPPQGSVAGFGGGIPIVVGGQLYGEQECGEYCASRGYAEQNSTNVGKVIIGYNSTSNSLALVVSPDGLKSGGMTLDAIRDKLVGEGYDYVFGFDGGSSSTLIQDGDNVLVAPIWYKDNTIPTGVTITGE